MHLCCRGDYYKGQMEDGHITGTGTGKWNACAQRPKGSGISSRWFDSGTSHFNETLSAPGWAIFQLPSFLERNVATAAVKQLGIHLTSQEMVRLTSEAHTLSLRRRQLSLNSTCHHLLSDSTKNSRPDMIVNRLNFYVKFCKGIE